MKLKRQLILQLAFLLSFIRCKVPNIVRLAIVSQMHCYTRT
ncbi:putative lipoprotein [Vibrio parahaemolyticus VPTS-2010]|nr:putative lipoprotein [Vibrio parahaemolyticus VPTS-2010]